MSRMVRTAHATGNRCDTLRYRTLRELNVAPKVEMAIMFGDAGRLWERATAREYDGGPRHIAFFRSFRKSSRASPLPHVPRSPERLELPRCRAGRTSVGWYARRTLWEVGAIRFAIAPYGRSVQYASLLNLPFSSAFDWVESEPHRVLRSKPSCAGDRRRICGAHLPAPFLL